MDGQEASEKHGHDGHEVRIHINRERRESPNPTTGEALYSLGQIPHHQQLYREVQGDEEDEPIENDKERLHLRQDEHFYSTEERHKGFTIIVNARPEHVPTKWVSFEQIVVLAYPKPPDGQDVLFTVGYYKGPKTNQEGTLVAGQTVKVKNGMVFNVKATNRS